VTVQDLWLLPELPPSKPIKGQEIICTVRQRYVSHNIFDSMGLGLGMGLYDAMVHYQ